MCSQSGQIVSGHGPLRAADNSRLQPTGHGPAAEASEAGHAARFTPIRRIAVADKKIIAVVGATGAQSGGLVRAILALVVIGMVVASGCRELSTADAADLKAAVAALQKNTDVFVGWIPIEAAARRASKKFTDAESRAFMKHFDDQIKAEFGGNVTNVQFRYLKGKRATIIRGARDGSRIRLYQIPEPEFDFTEWVNIPSALTGPFLAVPRGETNAMSERDQKYFESLFGRDVMLQDMQIEFTGSPRIIIIAGAMRWKPPRTHLHSIIVIVIG